MITVEQAKYLMKKKLPITHKGIKFIYIYELVGKLIDDRIWIYAVLMDKNQNSVTVAQLEDISHECEELKNISVVMQTLIKSLNSEVINLSTLITENTEVKKIKNSIETIRYVLNFLEKNLEK